MDFRCLSTVFAGVVCIALYTAELTATLTVEQIRGTINGPDDLPRKKVAALATSPAATYLHGINAEVQDSRRWPRCTKPCSTAADAIPMAAPLLRYYAAHHGAGLVS